LLLARMNLHNAPGYRLVLGGGWAERTFWTPASPNSRASTIS